MISLINLAVLFVAKVADNALSTTKTILVQRSRWILAGIAVIISDFIYFWITKRVVSANNEIAMLVVAVAGGVGCSLACFINEKMSKDRTYWIDEYQEKNQCLEQVPEGKRPSIESWERQKEKYKNRSNKS